MLDMRTGMREKSEGLILKTARSAMSYELKTVIGF